MSESETKSWYLSDNDPLDPWRRTVGLFGIGGVAIGRVVGHIVTTPLDVSLELMLGFGTVGVFSGILFQGAKERFAEAPGSNVVEGDHDRYD